MEYLVLSRMGELLLLSSILILGGLLVILNKRKKSKKDKQDKDNEESNMSFPGIYYPGGSYDFDDWTVIPTTSTAVLVVYGEGKWMTLGGGGNPQISYSNDGVTWTEGGFNTSGYAVNKLAYGNGMWMAAGPAVDQAVYTSGNGGVSWTTRSLPSTMGTNIGGIAHGSGLWVAAGYAGDIATSPNGITWTMRASLGNDYFQFLYFAEGRWFLRGNTKLFTSQNGINWTQVPSGRLGLMAYGEGVWAVIHFENPNFNVYTTVDGNSWNFKATIAQPPVTITSFSYGKGVWMYTYRTGGNSYIGTSKDLVTWTTHLVVTSMKNIHGTAWGDNTWVFASGTERGLLKKK